MILVLELIRNIPPFCVFVVVNCMIVIALALTLCDRYDDDSKELCIKIVKHMVIIGFLFGSTACLTPRAKGVALDWTTKLVKQGEMTHAEQKQIMETFCEQEKK